MRIARNPICSLEKTPAPLCIPAREYAERRASGGFT